MCGRAGVFVFVCSTDLQTLPHLVRPVTIGQQISSSDLMISYRFAVSEQGQVDVTRVKSCYQTTHIWSCLVTRHLDYPWFYTMHGCGSLPSATDGNPHTQLPQRLAHSGPVACGFNIAQDPPPHPLRLPGAQGQLCQEHTVTQPTSFIPGYSYWLSADNSNCLSGASYDNLALRNGDLGLYQPWPVGETPSG